MNLWFLGHFFSIVMIFSIALVLQSYSHSVELALPLIDSSKLAGHPYPKYQ
jgi:hypothetical protein